METNKIVSFIMAGFILGFLVWFSLANIENKAKDLHDNAQVVYGKILEKNSCRYKRRGCGYDSDNDYEIVFQYNVNQKVFKGKEIFDGEASQAKYKIGDTVRIFYSSKNPENSQLK